MVVAVHGPELARGAGFRLLRAVLLAAGLAALAWLLLALFWSAAAAADEAPSDGLLGGVVNGLTGGVSASSTSVATKPVAAVAPETVSAETVANVPAKATSPPAAPVAKPAAALKPVAKSVVKRTPRPVAHPRQPVAKPKPAPVVVAAMTKVDPENQVNRPGREPAPVKAPLAPSGSVTAGHDGPGAARGLHGVLPMASLAKPPAVTLTTSPAARDVAGRSAGLPLTSPD